MADLSAKKSDFASRASQLAADMLAIEDRASDLLLEWFALGYNSGGANEIIDTDLVGANQHMDAQGLQNAMGTYQVIDGAIDTNHQANLFRIAP